MNSPLSVRCFHLKWCFDSIVFLANCAFHNTGTDNAPLRLKLTVLIRWLLSRDLILLTSAVLFHTFGSWPLGTALKFVQTLPDACLIDQSSCHSKDLANPFMWKVSVFDLRNGKISTISRACGSLGGMTKIKNQPFVFQTAVSLGKNVLGFSKRPWQGNPKILTHL